MNFQSVRCAEDGIQLLQEPNDTEIGTGNGGDRRGYNGPSTSVGPLLQHWNGYFSLTSLDGGGEGDLGEPRILETHLFVLQYVIFYLKVCVIICLHVQTRLSNVHLSMHNVRTMFPHPYQSILS